MSKPLNIGYLNHFGELGGGEMCLLDLLGNLDRESFRPFLAAPGEGLLVGAAGGLSVPVDIIPFPKLSTLPHKIISAIYRLAGFIRKNKIDIIHANSQRTAAYMAVAGRICKTPYIFHDHEIIPLGWGHHLIGRSAARIIVVSKTAYSRYAGTSYPVTCVYNGVSPPKKEGLRKKCDIRAEFNIPQAANLIVMAGRMIGDKWHSHLIRAIESVLTECPHTCLIIVGGAMFAETKACKNALTELIESLGLQNNILITGFRDDIMSILNAADMVVHPAENESFGRVVIEAMALGKAVICAHTSGAAEIISSGKDGILVDPKHRSRLAEAIISLLNDPRRREVLGKNGRHKVLENFTVSQYAANMARVYREIVAG